MSSTLVATEDLISERKRLKAHVNRVWRLNQILPNGVSQRIADDYHAKLDRLDVIKTILANRQRDSERIKYNDRQRIYRSTQEERERRWESERLEREQRWAEASSHGYAERLRAREAMFPAPELPLPVKRDTIHGRRQSVFLSDEIDRRANAHMRYTPWAKRQRNRSRRYEGFR